MRLTLAFLILCVPGLGLAAGSLDDTPPTPTNTTTQCENGQVWDAATESCVTPQESRLDDDTLYRAVRELAYAGQYRQAQRVLAAMSDQTDDRVLTYWGFTARELGDAEGAMDYYAQAVTRNPGNLLARSYMGQAHVEAGALSLARAQLSEIRARGGRGTWAEVSLRLALETGRGFAY